MSTVPTAPSPGLTTAEAFQQLVESPELWERTGSNKALRRQFLHMLKVGEGISLNKKEELLTAASFEVEKEMIWEAPPIPEDWKLQLKELRKKKV